MKITRIVSLSVVVALLTLIAPVKITFTSEAALIEDPFNTAVAPHFSRVVYTLTEPSYSTPCDERGDFKALVGTPSITLADSRLVVAPVSTTKSSVVLSRTDAPAINQTRGYYELGLNVSNTLSWTNISLYDLHNDWINVSIHSGAFYYDYDSGSRQLGVFYSPAVAGRDYIVAFDLTTTSVTLFLYSTSGTLLADKYISGNRLVGGDLDEIRFELQGSSSTALRLDYLYVLGSSTLPSQTSVSWALEPLSSDDLAEERMVDLDPTAVALDQSLRQELFGFEDPSFGRSVTETQLLNAIGMTEIHEQRAAGRLVAEGYKDLRDSIEDSLVSYLAKNEEVETDEIYLIDYYMDYVQCKLEVHNDIVEMLADDFESSAGPVLETLGGSLDESSSTATVHTFSEDNLYYTDTGTSAIDILTFPASYIMSDLLRGMFDSDPLGLDDTREWTQDQLEKMYADTNARLDMTYNQTISAFRDWQQSTDEKYEQVRQDYLNFLSICQAQTTQLAQDYTEMQDRFERTVSKFFSYTENQFEATNAIIAKLLLQNEEFAESSREINEYFAGQLTKTNEVVLNISSAITQSLTGQDFWANVYSDGKAESEPLTFSSFFGNNVQTWTLVFIGIFIVVTVALVLTMALKPGRTARRRRM